MVSVLPFFKLIPLTAYPVDFSLTVAASCWYNKENGYTPPILQFCGSLVCATAEMAVGEIEVITADYKSFENAKDEYQEKLIHLLIKHL